MAYDAPPPQEPLPSYTDTVRVSFENSLMPMFTIIQIICIIFAAVLFVAHLFNARLFGSDTSAIQYVCAAIFAVCFVIHVFVIVAGHNMRGSRKVPIIVTVSISLALIAQIMSVAQLYARKEIVMARCLSASGVSSANVSDQSDVMDACHSVWEGYVVWNIVWLVAIVLVGPVFALVAFKCDMREKKAAQANAFVSQGGPSWDGDAYAMSTVPPYDPSTDPLSQQERELADAKLDYPDPDYHDHDHRAPPSFH